MKIGNLRDWEIIDLGQKISFPAEGERRVGFDVMASTWCSITAEYVDEDGVVVAVPVAAGRGFMRVEYVVSGPSAIVARSVGECDVAVRGVARSSVVAASDEPSFASAMTGGRRNDEVSRMLYVMKLNEKRREERMAFTIAEMKARSAAEAAVKAAEEAAQEPDPGKGKRDAAQEPDPGKGKPDAAPSA